MNDNRLNYIKNETNLTVYPSVSHIINSRFYVHVTVVKSQFIVTLLPLRWDPTGRNTYQHNSHLSPGVGYILRHSCNIWDFIHNSLSCVQLCLPQQKVGMQRKINQWVTYIHTLTRTYPHSPRRIVRLTSPKLNYFIILGCYLIFISVFLGPIPTIDPRVFEAQCHVSSTFICIIIYSYIHLALTQLQNWLVVVGYTLAFSTILSKMVRVFHIFNNPTAKKQVIIL